MSNPNIEPMLCSTGLSTILTDKSEGIFPNFWIAQEKLDGHRAIMVSKNNENWFYSRRNSVVTGEKEDNTGKLPYLKLINFNNIIGVDDCIFDGELTILGESSDSSKVQHILGSTPERAFELWEQGYQLCYNIFDVIKWDGQWQVNLPLIDRLRFIEIVKRKLNELPVYLNIRVVDSYGHKELIEQYNSSIKECDDFEQLLESVYEKGGEIKSEAGIDMILATSSIDSKQKEEPRYFYVDDTFAIFLREKGKNMPYFAGRVEDITKFQ